MWRLHLFGLQVLAGCISAASPPQPLRFLHASHHFREVTFLLGEDPIINAAPPQSLTFTNHNHSALSRVGVRSVTNASHHYAGASPSQWYAAEALLYGNFFWLVDVSAVASKVLAVQYPDAVMEQYRIAGSKVLVLVNGFWSKSLWLYVKVGTSMMSIRSTPLPPTTSGSSLEYMLLPSSPASTL